MTLFRSILHRPFFIRLFNWEYWSFNTIYAPISIIWLWLCIRARSFFFFSASNPSIEYGGFLMESKKAIYDSMPEEFYPKTLFVQKNSIADDILEELKFAEFQYPLIAKPDIGGRGRGVKKINNESELVAYVYASQLDFLVQEFVPFPNEVGIFYYRYPTASKGVISGIVRKEFLSVQGDGVSTIRQLGMKHKRFILQLKEVEKMWGEKLEMVLPEGESLELVPYGNHARGSKFLDESYMADRELTHTIDRVCKQIHGFYYGRLDIRFTTWKELKQGKNFSVIEVNGAGAEPTHMYDPKHSIFFAWKEIIRHWIILRKISRMNHKEGISYLSFKEGRKMFKANRELDKILASQHV